VAMTTPYGTTTFSKGETNWSEVGDAGSRWLEATDPLGGTERLEYIYFGTRAGLPLAEPANLVPAGFAPHNVALQMMNTFYWDQRTMALHPGDYSKASLTHWLRNADRTKISSTPASEKSPLENRVWYAYPDQGPYDEEGSSPFPTGVARVLDDGTTQLRQFSYTTLGKVTRQVDPVGRENLYEYDENEIDLLRVKQRTATGDVLLAEATYNGQHRPLALTNAARQTTHLTYNSHGQVASIETPARAGITEPRISRYTYTSDGFLETGEDPLAGTTVRFTPDAQGRIRSVAFDGYTFVVDHDDFDRLTRITHPDGTYQEVVYDRLDPVRTRDRLGRWTASTHNARRQLTTFRDPLGRLLTFDWCGCGSLDGVTDGRGQTTRWERDLQGRVVRETRSNGASIEYRHENTTSRLREVIDAKAQTRHYEYYRDDNLKKITYLNTTVPTPSVTFTYDPVYDRLATIQDGLGTSTYGYHPVGDTPVLGAGWLATVDGPLGDDTVSFTYDELSRLVERRVGTGPSSRWHYDLVGRIVGEDGPLGSFQFEYEGVTPRLRRIVYPNGQETQHQFFDNAGGRRLREIRNLGPGGAHLSTFQYEYDAGGNVRRWSRQLGGAAADAFELRYDNADQLVGALLQSAAPQPQALKRYAYSYDPAGNRTAAQADGVATSSAHDAGNRLVRQQSAGAVLLSGVVSEPATLTVAGQPLPVAANNRFEGWTAVAPGANSVSVEARDAAGNQRTYTYGIGVPAESRDLAYDANGNLTSDGERTFEWDGEDRLAAVQEGSRRSEFAYDGRSRLARITEKQGGSVLEERRLIWCGGVRCEERRADGTVVRRFLDHGLQEDGQSYYYTLDHLGSVRELVDEAGTVRARYDYDPFGASQKLSGDRDSVVGFTGHLVHPPSGLLLAPARPYDAQLGRWVQPDPAGFADGLNLYRYVWNNPIKYTDPSGEFAMVPILAMAAMVLGLVLGMPSTANPPGPGDPVYFMPDPPPFLAMGGMIKTTGKLVIMCVTKRAARRAALRAAGIGKNGARQQLPPEPLRPGSQAPTGPPGTRTTVVDPQTGAKVHYDPWGHRLPDGTTIPPHYGVEIPGQPTKHFTWPTTHNPANNR
jgi:RHS repeat-associated protein